MSVNPNKNKMNISGIMPKVFNIFSPLRLMTVRFQNHLEW